MDVGREWVAEEVSGCRFADRRLVCAVKFWSRKQFKGTQALKKRINPTRIPIEGKRPAIYTVQRLQTPEQVST